MDALFWFFLIFDNWFLNSCQLIFDLLFDTDLDLAVYCLVSLFSWFDVAAVQNSSGLQWYINDIK